MSETGFAWDNLWKWAVMLPGTKRARMTLTGWQLFLVALPAVLAHWWGWWGVGAGIIAGFFIHEVVFSAYVRWIVGIPMMDDGDVVGSAHKADYTYERWIGPVR